jgi:hypothetical protein
VARKSATPCFHLAHTIRLFSQLYCGPPTPILPCFPFFSVVNKLLQPQEMVVATVDLLIAAIHSSHRMLSPIWGGFPNDLKTLMQTWEHAIFTDLFKDKRTKATQEEI